MCVRMVRDNIPCSYDPQGDFLEQAKNCSEVIVEYLPGDVMLETFLKHVQECVKNGTCLPFTVKVNYGSYLSGFQTKKQIAQAMNDINLNEVIKLLALTHRNTDQKLAEISDICNREVNGK